MGEGTGKGGGAGQGAGGKGRGAKPPGKPKKPKLPENAPADIKDFVDCKGNALELRSGPVNWMPLPKFAQEADAAPTATFEQGTAPGTINATLGWGIISVTITRPLLRG
jgi:hypothetical protein